MSDKASMSLTARAYITFVIVVGAAVLWRGLFPWGSGDLPRFLWYLVLAVPASCLKVRLPGVTGTMSVLFVFLLAGIVELGLAQTLVISTVCAVVQSFWHARVRPRPVQVLFSIANLAFAIYAAHLVYHSGWLFTSYLETPFRLAAAASVFFLANTFPVAAVIALTEQKSLHQVWSNFYCWSFPYYLVGAAIVGVFGFANRLLNWQAWVLILPVVYVIYRSYLLYLKQLDSERNQAEEQRRHAEEVARLHAQTVDALSAAVAARAKLDAVIQASPLAILGLDRRGNVSNWNTMAERMFGWTQAEVLNRPVPVAGGRPDEIIRDIVQPTLSGDALSAAETRHYRKDGSSFEAAVWTAALRGSDGEVSGILMTVADVSDRRRLEDQLRLSQKMEAVGRLAGGIAHDFNNLLTVINGYSAMLLDSVKHDPSVASQVQEIANAGDRAADLVSKLLTFSRRQMIQPKPLNVNYLVRDVERMLRRLIGEHIDLRTLLDSDAGWIRADPNQIEGVLMNLATNARDAMPEGGTLTIQTAHAEVAADDHLQEPDLPAGSYVRLVVSDTGQGMDLETQQHIFEPFFTTKHGKGTGLGLSSVYGGIEQNGGHIFVSSSVGKGTTFSIYLPRLERTADSAVQLPAAQKPTPGHETILLVEDEGAVRRMLRGALTNAGYCVWEAGHGAEALETWAARIANIDLLVTDIVMPVMNGVKLAEELRRLRPGLKVVFMSGHAADTITRQGALDPDVELLAKPFPPAVLVRKVREVLDARPSSDRSLSAL